MISKVLVRGILAAIVALLAFGATPAAAKQCVWNKAGFILRVDWFTPGTYTVTQNPVDGFNEYSFTAQPVQTDNTIFAPSGRCIDRGPTQYDAVLSMCATDPSFNSSRAVLYPNDWSPERRYNDCSIFLSTTPSLTRYLDVWGWMFGPETGDGGAI